ncbi:hypothetical protein GGR88_001960 [Sphingomonas jejuensis]|uniref:PepSY domain-containing protein n=1 Tax=Sphingomonas jejuensis TaxID=904715 RepID=A0ABX0XP30_9SPHN|nr:hypothetical protein [Sphingomonas jejuensis]
MSVRGTLGRIHLWLGWIVGVPLLLWTATGLFMVARPIEEVRGTALRRDPPPFVTGAAVVPAAGPLRALQVEVGPAGPYWVATRADGSVARARMEDGSLLPPVSAQEARVIAAARYVPASPIVRVLRHAAEDAPIDLRQPRPSWQVRFEDGTNLYVDADSGRVLALRTRQWRWFDLMWGLHIMDVQSREDTSHPILIGFAAVSLVGVLIGIILMPMAARRKRQGR